MPFFRFFKKNPHAAHAAQIYDDLLIKARDPVWFADYHVDDTVDGRFDMICLWVSLMIAHLRRIEADPDLPQALFDRMFEDMEGNLRMMGVSDLAIPRRVKAMWNAFNGRMHSYDAAWGDETAFMEAVHTNVYRGKDVDAARLAKMVTQITTMAKTLPGLASGKSAAA